MRTSNKIICAAGILASLTCLAYAEQGRLAFFGGGTTVIIVTIQNQPYCKDQKKSRDYPRDFLYWYGKSCMICSSSMSSFSLPSTSVNQSSGFNCTTSQDPSNE